MFLKKLTIRNFQSFGSVPTTMTFSRRLTTFLGANAAGKTAACQALLRLFSVVAAQRQVRPTACHGTAAPIPPSSGDVIADRSLPSRFSFLPARGSRLSHWLTPGLLHQLTTRMFSAAYSTAATSASPLCSSGGDGRAGGIGGGAGPR